MWNVRSAEHKISEIMQYFSDKTIDIALLSETWQANALPGKYDSFTAAIKDFGAAEELDLNCFHCPRLSGRKGGGVATLYKTCHCVKHFSLKHEFETFECVVTTVEHEKFPFLLGNIYRPPAVPSFNYNNFLDDFANLLMLLTYSNKPIVLAGDFNIKINLPRNPNTLSFSTLLSEFNLTPILPEFPTHCQGNTLDFAILSHSFLSYSPSISVDSSVTLSDHFPLTLSLTFPSFISSSSSSATCLKT